MTSIINVLSFDIGIKNMAYCYASIINDGDTKNLNLKNLNKNGQIIIITPNKNDILNKVLKSTT